MSSLEPKSTDPVKLAELCLRSKGEVELLKIYEFKDDADAHDDEKHDSLAVEFETAFGEAVEKLEQLFGEAHVIEDEEEADTIPIGGIFCAATWNVQGTTLYLVAAHEDREPPYLLLVGTV